MRLHVDFYLRLGCSLRLPVWLYSCAAFSRRRCSGVASQSSMDRSSPPPGRLAAVLGCYLCFALLCPTVFWFNFAHHFAASFVDRSSPPSGRLAAVLDCCLRYALLWPTGISLLLRHGACTAPAHVAALAAHTMPRCFAQRHTISLRLGRAARGACPPSPPSCNREIPSRTCDTIRATKPSVHLQQGFSHGRGVVSNSSLHYNSSDATGRRSVTAKLYRSSSNGTRSTRVVGSGVTSISRESGGRLPTHAWSNR